MLITLVCVALVALVYVFTNKKLNKYSKILIVIIIAIVFGVNYEIISVERTLKEVEDKVSKVVDVCGSTYIRVGGETAQIKVNEEWVNLEDIKIIGGISSEKITMRYGDEEIYLGESGVVNTIRVMDKIGLLEKSSSD